MITYPTHEVFRSFQGEGVHMGRPAFFIRTYGCPVHCPWCDSAGTWHKDFVPDHIEKMTTDQMVKEALEEPKVEFVVITGGEPCVHDLFPLTLELAQWGMPTHLETSGAFSIKGSFSWITLSPKKWKLPLASAVGKANEFKFIIETPEDIAFYTGVLINLGVVFVGNCSVPIWLHPEWSQRENPVVLKAISDAVVNGRGVYRAGFQIHKSYRVDLNDTRSKPAVPLGGNPDKGY